MGIVSQFPSGGKGVLLYRGIQSTLAVSVQRYFSLRESRGKDECQSTITVAEAA